MLAALVFLIAGAAAEETTGNEFTVLGDVLIRYNGPGGEVTVPEGITELGEGAFAETNITKVNLPGTLKVIRSYCFSDCMNLEEITLPASLTELEKYTDDQGVTVWQAQVFCRNPRLTAINVESGNTHYTSVDGVLFTADRKKLLYYPDGKNAGGTYDIPEGTTELGYTAFSSPALTGITVPSSMPEMYRTRDGALKKSFIQESREWEDHQSLWANPLLWIGLMILFLSGITGLILYRRRENNARTWL